MRFEEEVAIYQFGQGVLPADDLFDRFNRLTQAEKENLFDELFSLVWKTKQNVSDVEQAIEDLFGKSTDAAGSELKNHWFCVALIDHWSKPDIQYFMVVSDVPDALPEGKYEKTYRLLLRLFKTYYQRRQAMRLETPDNWRYWDLSQPETVEELIKAYQDLVEDVYTNLELRSDFLSLARLEYEQKQARLQQPVPEIRYGFATYDEVLTESIKAYNWKSIPRYRLIEFLQNALKERYGLNTEKSIIILREVVDRHVQEQYITEL